MRADPLRRTKQGELANEYGNAASRQAIAVAMEAVGGVDAAYARPSGTLPQPTTAKRDWWWEKKMCAAPYAYGP